MSYLGNIPQLDREISTYTATAGQTMFGCSTATDSFEVFKNGRKLTKLDFTVVDSNVVLSSPAALNDKIVVITYSTSVPPESVYTRTQTAAALVTDAKAADNFIPITEFKNKNRIINGQFDVWQRGTGRAAAVLNGAVYVADQWRVGALDSTVAINRQSFTPGQTEVPMNPYYYHEVILSGTSSTSVCSIEQMVDPVTRYHNTYVTMSFWAKATTAGKKMAIEVTQAMGTGGSGSQIIHEELLNLNTTWTKYEIPMFCPSISGAVPASNNCLQIYFTICMGTAAIYYPRGSGVGVQTGTFHLANVQVEYGQVATEYDQLTFHENFRRCQRYYQGNQSYNQLVTSDVTSGALYHRQNLFYTPMRGEPTVTLDANQASSIFSATVGSINQVSALGFFESRTASSTGAGHFASHWSADISI